MTNRNITLQVWKNNSEKISAIQGEVDSRNLIIRLVDLSGPINLTNRTVNFIAKKPDGTVVFNSAEIIDSENGLVQVHLTSQICAVAGTMSSCEIHIIDECGNTLIAKGFDIEVVESLGEAVEESISEYTAYEQLVSSLNTHESDKTNPHGVTAEQIGAMPDTLKYGARLEIEGTDLSLKDQDGSVLNTVSIPATTDSVNTEQYEELESQLGAHKGDKTNPHRVTAEQIGAMPDTSKYGARLEIEGTDLSLKDQDGSVLNTVSIPNKTYSIATTSTDGLMSSSDKAKLDGLQAGESLNVQADWNQTNEDSNDYIKNKPTTVSSFTNDAGYLTEETDPTVPTWAKAAAKPTYNYSEIEDTPAIPTKVSELTNDSNFLTEESDPTVPAWAKAETKPTYDYTEIENTPTKLSAFENDMGYSSTTVKPEYEYSDIKNAPTKVSEFENDAVYISDILPRTFPNPWYGVNTTGMTKKPIAICYANNMYVVGAYSGHIYTSTDLVTWTQQTSPATDQINSIIYEGGYFVATGHSGTLITSSDGINWTKVELSITNNCFHQLYVNSTYWVACTGGTLLKSIDAVNWEIITIEGAASLKDIVYGNGLYVAMGYSGTLVTSPDGINWTVGTIPTTKTVMKLCYANGFFIAVGASGIMLHSTDGLTWELMDPSPSSNYLYHVQYTGREYVIVGDETALTSKDGYNWVTDKVYTNQMINGLLCEEDRYIAVVDRYATDAPNVLIKRVTLSGLLEHLMTK